MKVTQYTQEQIQVMVEEARKQRQEAIDTMHSTDDPTIYLPLLMEVSRKEIWIQMQKGNMPACKRCVEEYSHPTVKELLQRQEQATQKPPRKRRYILKETDSDILPQARRATKYINANQHRRKEQPQPPREGFTELPMEFKF